MYIFSPFPIEALGVEEAASRAEEEDSGVEGLTSGVAGELQLIRKLAATAIRDANTIEVFFMRTFLILFLFT